MAVTFFRVELFFLSQGTSKTSHTSQCDNNFTGEALGTLQALGLGLFFATVRCYLGPSIQLGISGGSYDVISGGRRMCMGK